jgi:UPF0042 nucleotide-binding protein
MQMQVFVGQHVLEHLAQLQSYVKEVISSPAQQLTLVFESFAFKRGIPVHAD